MIALLLASAYFVGNDACAKCHPAIYRSYAVTPMAQSSGRATEPLPTGGFRHEGSQTRYQTEGRIIHYNGKSQAVDYFIGSGAEGRSYLYRMNGFLYQAPVTWYGRHARWSMSPGYENDTESRWSRAIEPSCLYCHASQVKAIYGTQNRYAEPAFEQPGIACERCHGPGSEHVNGRGPMVNPAKLEPGQRDSVCSQCHLTGEARIEKPDRRIAQYRPGELLSDYVSYFVPAGPARPDLKVASHVEKLEASRCKQASGDRLSCITCHDPHSVPAAAERGTFYRAKCLTCHQPHECRRGPDCTGCHMPRSLATDAGGHGVFTDHSIPRKPRAAGAAPKDWRLASFRGFSADARSLGLAYAEVGLRSGDARQLTEAVRLLQTVKPDGEVLVRLADLVQRGGDLDRAARLYASALALDPNSVVAMVNLGGIEAGRGNYTRASQLWKAALERNPLLPEAHANLDRLRAAGH